jgi:pullulanase
MNTLFSSSILLITALMMLSCSGRQTEFATYEEYPKAVHTDLWLAYSPEATTFKLWSPVSEAVRVNLYESSTAKVKNASHSLAVNEKGVWTKTVVGDLAKTYYTFQVQVKGKWLAETPGIYAKAVGVNGERAMVLDFNTTNPEGWSTDAGPTINKPNEAIIYELHIRDMTIHPNANSSMPGKYLGLVEESTKGPSGVATAIDHIKDLGITHVHLLPTYDHYSIDEANLDSAQFNWGYDPQNYNVPEGSFSSDPYNAEIRIIEFKKMVKAFHDNGIGVILDVVYNHTGKTAEANFNREVPGYYYRHWEDGKLSDASACGNETASDRTMMRKFMLESVSYWAKEYHLDGFRFDLMGIHDITSMNGITKALKAINPNIIIYGEGWTAGDSPLPEKRRALKKHTRQMPQLAAFSDDIRDGLKGSVFEDKSTGFVSGAKDTEASVKFGIVGSIEHPQIDYPAVNYSDAPWALEPWQAISYVSCHDNHTLYDKLVVSRPEATEEEIIAMHKLANAVVLTSQAIPFIHAGAEMLRTKNGEHNSYNLPDSINQIDWSRKVAYADVYQYYKNLIAFRKAHPAFSLPSAKELRQHLLFDQVKQGLVSYTLSGNANNDQWKNIKVIYNANTVTETVVIKGSWNIAVIGDQFDNKAMDEVRTSVEVPAISMMILFQE